MKFLSFSIFLFFLAICDHIYGQELKVELYVRDSISGVSIEGAELYDIDNGLLGYSDIDGKLSVRIEKKNTNLILLAYGYNILEFKGSEINNGIEFLLSPIFESLTEVEVVARNTKIFSLKRILLLKRPHKQTNVPPITEQLNKIEMEIIKLAIHEKPNQVKG